MQLISRLEHDSRLVRAVAAGQRARLIRPGKVRNGLRGVWLGHPLHLVLAQAPAGAWLSASIVDVLGDHRSARRLAATGSGRRGPGRGGGTPPTGLSSTSSRCVSAWCMRPRGAGGAIQVCLPGAG